MTSFDVTAFGETMLRYSVPVGHRLAKSSSLDVVIGGTETNTLGALAGLGRRCGWLSGLPQHALGDFVIRHLKAAGVDTSAVVRNHHRMGCYYVEFATDPRPIQVIYDRQNSAVSELMPADINWDYLLDTRILHLTGITPALSTGCHDIMKEAISKAKQRGITVSFDVNYRSKLWSAKDAQKTLRPLIAAVDILICGAGDASTVFGLNGEAQTVLSELSQLTSAKHVILTRSDQGSATLQDGNFVEVAARPAIVVDRLGAGDAFAAGVLDGFLDEDVVSGMQRGSVLSSIALSEHGDMMSTNRAELKAIMDTAQASLQR